MSDEMNPRLKHWLGTPKWRKSGEKKDGKSKSFLKKLFREIVGTWEI